MLAVTNQLPVPPFQKDILHDLARHWDESDRPMVPWVYLIFLLKNGIVFLLYQSVDCHNFSNMIDSLATSSINFFRICSCISSGLSQNPPDPWSFHSVYPFLMLWNLFWERHNFCKSWGMKAVKRYINPGRTPWFTISPHRWSAGWQITALPELQWNVCQNF